MSAGTVERIYYATNVATIQKEKPLLSSRRIPYFQTHKQRWKKHKLVRGSLRGPKQRVAVLDKVSCNIRDWTGKLVAN